MRTVDFGKVTIADWEQVVAASLGGRDFTEELVSRTRDGIAIKPLYTAADAPHPAPISPTPSSQARLERGWDVRQQFDASDAQCNHGILRELERGVTSIELLPPTEGWTLATLRQVTAGVLFDLAGVALAPHANINAAHALLAVVSEQNATPALVWLGLDPIGEMLREGATDSGAQADVLKAVAVLIPKMCEGKTLTVDTTHYAEAGATPVQELSFSIATAVDYMRCLERFDVSPSRCARSIGFRLSVDADLFVNIAKLRAARRIWSRALQASGVEPASAPQSQHVVTNPIMYSPIDESVNILRATTAAFAAATAGADALTVIPFNETLDTSNEFARRIARNTQTLLIDEAHLCRVVDPAAGSWFIESLTQELAVAAWSKFQAIEADGGIVAAIASGSVQSALDTAWQKRLNTIRSRAEVLTGVSSYPNLSEQVNPRAVTEGTTRRANLPKRRLAGPFVALHETSDRYLQVTGERPRVHIAVLGDSFGHRTRSTWVENLLAMAGIVGLGSQAPGATSPLQAQARFIASGLTTAIICATNEYLSQRGSATVLALREACATQIILVGQQSELPASLHNSDIDEFWYHGMDVVAALTRLQKYLDLHRTQSAKP